MDDLATASRRGAGGALDAARYAERPLHCGRRELHPLR